MPPVLARHERRGLSYLRGGEGPPLLLLHGIPGSSHSWEPVGTSLASQYEVLIPDLSGFGHSEGLDRDLHLDHEFYMEAHAETVQGLLDALEIDSFFLGGHGFGGAVALTLIRLFPAYAPRGLVLSAPSLFDSAHAPWPLRIAGVPGLGPLAVRLLAGTRLGLRLVYWAAVCNRASFGRDAFEKHLTPSGIEQTRRILQRGLAGRTDRYAEMEALLSCLDAPTLVLWGDRDPLLPADAIRGLVDILPDATPVLFKDTGHFVPEERPDGVAWHVEDFFRARSSHSPRPVWERGSRS